MLSRFVEGEDRQQPTLLPSCLDDYVEEENPVRVVDVSVDELELSSLGFSGVVPAATGRPSNHPAMLLKLYNYGYLYRVQSSRRLVREAGRNLELMWLTGRLAPDHQTIANFRRDHGPAIQAGASFALAEAQIVLAKLLERYSFDVQGQAPVLPLALLTLGASREPTFRLHAST